MTSGSPGHPSALQTGRGEGETINEGEKVNLFRDRRILISDALDAITIFTSPQSISLMLPFLKPLIGIVAHIAILLLCVPILTIFYEKNLYLKSVAATTEEILSIRDKEVQCDFLLCVYFVSVKEQLMWSLKNQVELPLNHPIPWSKGRHISM